jgi:hypothetical protein
VPVDAAGGDAVELGLREKAMERKAKATRGLAIDRRIVVVGGTTLAAVSALGAGAPLQVVQAQQPAAQPIAPSPSWRRALPPGPDERVKITKLTPPTSRAMPISGLGRWSTSTIAGLPSPR